jgi:hypothetical protein
LLHYLQLCFLKLIIRRNDDNLSPLIKLIKILDKWDVYTQEVLIDTLKHLWSDEKDSGGCEVAGLAGLDSVGAGIHKGELVASLGVREALLGQLVHLPRQLKEHALDRLPRQRVLRLQSQHVIGLRLLVQGDCEESRFRGDLQRLREV